MPKKHKTPFPAPYMVSTREFLEALEVYNKIRIDTGLPIIPEEASRQHVHHYFTNPWIFTRMVRLNLLERVFLAETQPNDYGTNAAIAFYVAEALKEIRRDKVLLKSPKEIINDEQQKIRSRIEHIWRRLWDQHKVPGVNPPKKQQKLFNQKAKSALAHELYQKGNNTDEHIREVLLERFGDNLHQMLYQGSVMFREAEAVRLEAERVASQEAFQKSLRDEQPKLRTIQSRSSDKRGFVYVVTSPTFPGWVKIGQTMDLTQRLVGFNTHTPHGDFVFAFYHGFPDRQLAERVIHKFFAKRRGPNGEWFQMTVEEARAAILELSERIEERLAA